MTKKDIYAKYGIPYKKEGKKEYLYCEPLKKWITRPLPYASNKKVGNAYTWSIAHGSETVNINDEKTLDAVKDVMKNAGIESIRLSCPMHCKGCYCDGGCYNFPRNKAAAMEKLILAMFHTEWLEKAISAQIEADKVKLCRIHAQGDFTVIGMDGTNKAYVHMWERIARRFSSVVFWTYTKDSRALKVFRGVANIFITPSITPRGINYGTCAELLKMHRALVEMGYKVHICACGTPYEKHCADCETGCKAIGKECDFVLFIKHSAGNYKAGVKDIEDYKAICKIIARQNN